MKKYFAMCILISSSISAFPVYSAENVPTLLSNKSIAARNIEWTDLMPAEDLQLLESMKPVDHDTLSKAELAKDKKLKNNSLKLSDSTQQASTESATKKANEPPKKRTWKDALVSTKVRPEFNNVKIKLGGYIVPLDYDNNQLVKTFFFVPYFGACIHVPPPPPNQIIYVRIPKGLKLKDIYTPYSVIGTLRVETVEKDIGVSSYSLDAETAVVYKEE